MEGPFPELEKTRGKCKQKQLRVHPEHLRSLNFCEMSRMGCHVGHTRLESRGEVGEDAINSGVTSMEMGVNVVGE